MFEQLAVAADSAFWEAWLGHRLGIVPEHEDDRSLLPLTDVVICTRDRPRDLRKCLSDLMAMPQDGQRYLVVDNASATGETLEVVQAFPQVRYVREDRPGLDIARNTGIGATSATSSPSSTMTPPPIHNGFASSAATSRTPRSWRRAG